MINELCKLIISIGQVISDNKDLLTQLDAAIGDGDHGINMERGFNAISQRIFSWEGETQASILKKSGMTLISTVGGASGPLYGTAFLKASAVLSTTNIITLSTYDDIFLSIVEGIMELGKADRGEKTMLDALIPAYNDFSKGIAKGDDLISCLKFSLKAAEEGVQYTKSIRATKGRASYLGDRSIGHADPGATSSMLIIRAIYDFISERQEYLKW